MGEKGSRKRKRTSIVDEESTEDNTSLNHSNVEGEILSPKQKSAKKRRKVESVAVEESTEKKVVEKKKDKKKLTDIVEEEEVIERKSERQKNKKKNSEQDNNDEVIKKDKKKKSKVANENTDVEKENVNNKNNKNKKKKDKKPTKSSESNDSLVEESSGKNKKKDKKSDSFGVVDKKLLKEAGGKVKEMETESTGTPSGINRAIEYLRTWHKNRSAWKFNKRFQTLLIKAVYNPVIIDEDDFQTLMLYLEASKGNAREKLLADAKALVDVEDDHNAESIDPDMEKRARHVMQMLG